MKPRVSGASEVVEEEAEVVEVAVVGKMTEVDGEGEGGEVALEDLETGSRKAVDVEVVVATSKEATWVETSTKVVAILAETLVEEVADKVETLVAQG